MANMGKLTGSSPGATLEFWYLSDVDNKLVAIGREYGDRYSHWIAIPVEGSPEYLVHYDTAVHGNLEEFRLNGVRRAHSDPVTVADLLDPQRVLQILDRPLL